MCRNVIVAKQLYWNHSSARCSPVNLLYIFKTIFPKNKSEGLLLYFYVYLVDRYFLVILPRGVFRILSNTHDSFQRNIIGWKTLTIFTKKWNKMKEWQGKDDHEGLTRSELHLCLLRFSFVHPTFISHIYLFLLIKISLLLLLRF